MATDFDALLKDIEAGCTLHHYAAHAAATALARNWSDAASDGTPLAGVVAPDVQQVRSLLDDFIHSASATPNGSEASSGLDVLMEALLAGSSLHHFAAHDAAAVLVQNWKAALVDGATPKRLADADGVPVLDLLAEFGRRASALATTDDPRSRASPQPRM